MVVIWIVEVEGDMLWHAWANRGADSDPVETRCGQFWTFIARDTVEDPIPDGEQQCPLCLARVPS